MEPAPNPVHKSGNRNIYCPYYEEYLDHAVEHRWQYWNCYECPHKLRQEPTSSIQTVRDPSPCYELPSKLHQEAMYGL